MLTCQKYENYNEHVFCPPKLAPPPGLMPERNHIALENNLFCSDDRLRYALRYHLNSPWGKRSSKHLRWYKMFFFGVLWSNDVADWPNMYEAIMEYWGKGKQVFPALFIISSQNLNSKKNWIFLYFQRANCTPSPWPLSFCSWFHCHEKVINPDLW